MKSLTYSPPLPLLLFLCLSPKFGQAQTVPGEVTTAAGAGAYSTYLDPNADGWITTSGAAFTGGTTEAVEFEPIPASVTGWIELVDVSETNGDVNPICGNSDLITDDDGGDFAYYNIVDPTPLAPTSGDEVMLIRFRLANIPNGSFGYNFLFDTDMTYGGGIDANGICGNQGFEREVQFANGGGNKGVSVYNVDGSTTSTATICGKCVTDTEVQRAHAASGGGCPVANNKTPTLTTFPVPLVHLGIPSDIDITTLYVAAGTANSGNGTSVLGGGNASDIGALDLQNAGCPACSTLAGCALFDCQTDCVNAAFVSSNLPVTLTGFSVVATAGGHRVQWTTEGEENNAAFYVAHSTDGVNWKDLARLPGNGTTAERKTYTYLHERPTVGDNYYRLRQEDYDGTLTTSAVRYSRHRGTELGDQSFAVYPTVVTDGYLYVRAPAPLSATAHRYTITNTSGQPQQVAHIRNGANSSLDVSQLPSGAYFIRWDDGRSSHTRQFFK